ncbi:unnamed protein product [Urochloa humidicola]
MAPPFRLWADLHPDLLVHIADRIGDPKAYASARGACTSWRRALAPLFPALLAVAEGATMSTIRPSAASLLMPGSSFELAHVASGSRCVGSNGGWLALCVRVVDRRLNNQRATSTAFFLANPVTGAEIALPPLRHDAMWITKAVFAPNPAADDFAVAAICDADTIIYVTAGATSWSVLGPVFPARMDNHFADLVYNDQGHKVYCLTRLGLVYVLHLPDRRRRKPAVVLDATKLSVLRPPESIGVMQRDHPDMTLQVTIAPYWIQRAPTTWSSSRGNEDWDDEAPQNPYWTTLISEEPPQEPELDAPARIEFLPSADAFVRPYHAVSAIANAKHLVFCQGNMY